VGIEGLNSGEIGNDTNDDQSAGADINQVYYGENDTKYDDIEMSYVDNTTDFRSLDNNTNTLNQYINPNSSTNN